MGIPAKDNQIISNVEAATDSCKDSDRIIDFETVLVHCKGHETTDCSIILSYLQQTRIAGTDRLLSTISVPKYSILGVTAVLRYTWQHRAKLKHWFKLRDNTVEYLESVGVDENDFVPSSEVLRGLKELT